MARPRRHIYWLITAKPGIDCWWVPSLRGWYPLEEVFRQKKICCSHARAPNMRAAFRIARKCPAEEVYVIAQYNRKTRKWPQGYEREWILDRK